MSKWLRVMLGFLLAPIAPGLLAVAMGIILQFSNWSTTINWGEAIWVIMFSGVLGYPFAVVPGIPLYFFFKARNWNGLKTYSFAGGLLGLTIYLAYLPIQELVSNGPSSALERFFNTARTFLPLGVACGAFAGFSFWLIVRPDKATV